VWYLYTNFAGLVSLMKVLYVVFDFTSFVSSLWGRNDNPVEQVSEFKYLGYLISDYKSDLEDKIQTYNKINGVMQRHIEKQMTKETKLRIHNITAKAALKFGNELGPEETR
jgi:hypothetical protein